MTSENATENVTADDDNVIPLRPGASDTPQPQPPPRQDAPRQSSRRKRRGKPLTNAEALTWLRGKDGIEVDSYAALGLVWGWERSRTSKAVKAWVRAGDIEVTEAGRGGKITIRIPAERPARETGEPARHPGLAERENAPGAEREIHAQAERENDRESERESHRESEREFPAAPSREIPLASPVPAPAVASRVHADIGVAGMIYLTAATLAALGLEIVPVYFAVRGFVTLFPGEYYAVLVLAVVIDGAKMAAVGFLSAMGRLMPPLVWLALGLGIALTAAINVFSVYSQLVAAHVTDHTVEQADAAANATRDVVRLEATVMMQRRAVDDVRRQIEAHDAAVKAEITAKPKAATRIMDDGNRKRTAIADKLEKEIKHLEDLVAQEAEATAQSRKTSARTDAEAAPIAYLAKWLGLDASDRERVFQWQVAAIVLCADPFALALMWAVGSVKRRRRP
jgi:hypothetical protein